MRRAMFFIGELQVKKIIYMQNNTINTYTSWGEDLFDDSYTDDSENEKEQASLEDGENSQSQNNERTTTATIALSALNRYVHHQMHSK
ncbi:unnamed protein product [Adineta steineri]|uniref:Uncharacterized protein n=1 Tax=Adineta steineri TaxID=433720 RepID=A0A819W8T9_9BILA|nr:unnamed protein product [Adineta steineri]CAF4119070.1 unnamed protein product [Adineta steineri]